MSTPVQSTLEPRKTPLQARSTVTVEAISEATIQVLLADGPARLTTTRVAKRAGVSVGTLYQYYPNKESLLFSVLDQHLGNVVSAVEQACNEHHHDDLKTMVEALVTAFVDAKMGRPDISVALYSISAALNGAALARQITSRGQVALSAMLKTAAPEFQFEQVEFTALMLFSAMAGATRAILEAGALPEMVGKLRQQLPLLCYGYLVNAAVRTPPNSKS
jgi:AcrR family transcriptional regulator